jgi:hypothetical protein
VATLDEPYIFLATIVRTISTVAHHFAGKHRNPEKKNSPQLIIIIIITMRRRLQKLDFMLDISN